jgi:Mg-chelatase subunit ChlD
MTSNPNPTSRRRAKLAVFATLVAATALVAHVATSTPVEPLRPPPPQLGTAPRIEVVFVLDTTGSMSGLIEGAKRKIWSIANQMASGQPRPEIRMGLIGYRDRGDAYVTRIRDLSPDVDGLYGELQQLSAGGGGDTPESVNQALHEAVTHMSWTPGQDVYKVVFLVGDAPPHMDYQDDVPYAESVRLARRRGIVVNTVQCGRMANTTTVWQSIAVAGSGRFVAIRQDGGMVAIATPMDDDLARLNRDLADTVIAYGAADERAEIDDKRRRALEAPAPAAASRLAFMEKMGGRVNSGRADLVDAVKDGLADASSLDEEALPEEMRPMEPGEREAYVARKLEARTVIQRQIAKLSKKRDEYVVAEQDRLAEAGEGDGFDQQVLEAIRTQAAAKGIAY